MVIVAVEIRLTFLSLSSEQSGMNRMPLLQECLLPILEPGRGTAFVEWHAAPGLVPYPDALAAMEERAGLIARGAAPEAIWLVEHPPLYTAGTSARRADLTDPDRFPVFTAGRGGQYTYHGPGQRVVYVMLDLNQRGRDVRRFVATLEDWVIAALATFNISAGVRDGRVGVWVARPDKPPLPDGTPHDDKIAAIGVKLRRWVSFHGLSINVEPDLGHFDGIVPCGIRDHGVTSLVDLGLPVAMQDLDSALRQTFEPVFAARGMAGGDLRG
jgi:lipoyl(octanoyl) transferase